MLTQALRDARRFEEEKEREITPEMRPAYHLSARVGWLNDPNGFCYFQGKYHLFYQYHPYNSHWGPMHWGHATSTDLLHWDYLPAAMAPDQPYDRDGCFSGSALMLPDGRHLLMYTGVVNEEQDGRMRGIQAQCIAIGDGIDYGKYEKNPVISISNLPKGSSKYDFRDPKLWQGKDGRYYAVAVTDNPSKGGGQVLLFVSNDALKWRYETTIMSNNERIGLMWECPDFFEIDGKSVLMCSAMDMLPQDLKYYNGNGTFYITGEYDKEKGSFKEESDHAVDYGIDFYAPQTVVAPDGRRLMIAWMQNWDTCNLHTPDVPWFGQMTVPRELSVKDGRLYQKPIREIEQFRKNRILHKNIQFSHGEISLPGVRGRCVDMILEIMPAGKDIYQKFALRFAENAKYHTAVSFRPHEGILKIDRKFSGSRRAIIHQRRAAVGCKDGGIRMRLLLDRYSAEIFVGDGEKVMTTTISTELSAEDITFFVDGSVYISVEKYDLVM
ncbi:MAG: glycoside hydrolase family 32 protein [Lachnospiraceae bacterium]|nr:glycoside hydrolase family 32 protein [Lachnospiraceae bacterium]